MKIEYCLYILDVVETGSIRKAAEKRFITQQGLSQAIKSVERELGIEIFNRSGNRIDGQPSRLRYYRTRVRYRFQRSAAWSMARSRYV